MNTVWTYRYACAQYNFESCGAFTGLADRDQAMAVVRGQLDIKEEQHQGGLYGCRLKPNPKFEITELKESSAP